MSNDKWSNHKYYEEQYLRFRPIAESLIGTSWYSVNERTLDISLINIIEIKEDGFTLLDQNGTNYHPVNVQDNHRWKSCVLFDTIEKARTYVLTEVSYRINNHRDEIKSLNTIYTSGYKSKYDSEYESKFI